MAEPLDQWFRSSHARKIQFGARRCKHGHIVVGGALAAGGEEKFIGSGSEHRRQHRRSILDQSHAHAPVLAAGEIAARTVNRIDDPYQAIAYPFFAARALLPE